jgi:trans-aconitate 2-methyltransferase
MTAPAPKPTWNAELYDSSHSFVWKYGASLIELLSPQPGERILDLGCGTGHLTARIAETPTEVVGFDSSAEMVEQARRAYPALQFEVADARDFDFGTGFDAVFSNAVLHWVKEPAAAIQCIHAALRPGGRFVAEFGGHGNTCQMVEALLRQAANFGAADYQTPWYYPGIAEYSGLLENHGFEVTYANLFERPTPLEGDDGLKKWFEMFCGSLLNRFGPPERAQLLAAIEADLRPTLFRDGQWQADYRRLRVVALRHD